MKKLLLLVAAATFVTVGAVSAEETWKGTLSDSMCAAKHEVGKHGDKAADHQACVERCVKNGGQYVFVAGEKVYKIANQDFKDLKAHAGHEVMLTGEMKDDTITVAKVAMPKMEKSDKQ
jgi:hypothetical protein